ncbi:MAG: hypothetical protein E6356_16995 [Terrisporobacter othiniensis]|nr:hypothetical protein [Terrisporobacter othiniensis]
MEKITFKDLENKFYEVYPNGLIEKKSGKIEVQFSEKSNTYGYKGKIIEVAKKLNLNIESQEINIVSTLETVEDKIIYAKIYDEEIKKCEIRDGKLHYNGWSKGLKIYENKTGLYINCDAKRKYIKDIEVTEKEFNKQEEIKRNASEIRKIDIKIYRNFKILNGILYMNEKAVTSNDKKAVLKLIEDIAGNVSTKSIEDIIGTLDHIENTQEIKINDYERINFKTIEGIEIDAIYHNSSFEYDELQVFDARVWDIKKENFEFYRKLKLKKCNLVKIENYR